MTGAITLQFSHQSAKKSMTVGLPLHSAVLIVGESRSMARSMPIFDTGCVVWKENNATANKEDDKANSLRFNSGSDTSGSSSATVVVWVATGVTNGVSLSSSWYTDGILFFSVGPSVMSGKFTGLVWHWTLIG